MSREWTDAHVSVLLEESVAILAPTSGGTYIDCTAGAGGHASAILAASAPDGRLLAIDQDPSMLAIARERLTPYGDRGRCVLGSFGEVAEIAHDRGIAQANGIMFDLGVASPHLDDPDRGFSFQRDGPLDMRMAHDGRPSAADLVREMTFDELARVFRDYGEEPAARRIARTIVADRVRRPITRTVELADLVARLGARGGRVHPATRVFQALRIAVNDELGQLERGLAQAHEILAPGGVVAVIAFHSLEDRIVKQFLAERARDCVCPPRIPVCVCDHRATIQILIPGGLVPNEREIAANPRARSARLRAGRRVGALSVR